MSIKRIRSQIEYFKLYFVPLLTSCAAIKSLFFPDWPNWISGYLDNKTLLTIIFAILFFNILYLIYLVGRKPDLEQEKYLAIGEKITKSTHNLNESLRDTLYKLRSHRKNHKLSKTLLFEIFRNTSNNYVNEISRTLTLITNNEICVHIKEFTLNEKGEKQSDFVRTLSYCDNSKRTGTRHNLNEHNIIDNMHYELLLKSRSGHKYWPNFIETVKSYQEDEVFKINNTIWQEHYKSMILVPIQLDKIYDKKNKGKENHYNVLGILVVDSRILNAFTKEMETLITNYLKTFADGLYILFSEVQFLQAEDDIKSKL